MTRVRLTVIVATLLLGALAAPAAGHPKGRERAAGLASARKELRQLAAAGPNDPILRTLWDGYRRIGHEHPATVEQMKARFQELDRTLYAHDPARPTDLTAVLLARWEALVPINQRILGSAGVTPNARVVRARLRIVARRLERAREGWRVRSTRVTVGPLRSPDGIIAPPEQVDARKSGIQGVLVSEAEAHGGNAWSVQHDDGTIAFYWIDELRPLTPPRLPWMQGLWLPEP